MMVIVNPIYHEIIIDIIIVIIIVAMVVPTMQSTTAIDLPHELGQHHGLDNDPTTAIVVVVAAFFNNTNIMLPVLSNDETWIILP
jgi:biopolymer transport protein ExbD